MKPTLPLICIVMASTAVADETRQLDAHEHGVGALNIAVDGTTVAMEFHAPGADIVGFEYEAESDEDRKAIDAAVATLARPLDLFVPAAAAECTVVRASAELEGEGDHAGHDDHNDHAAHDDHDHDDHKDHDDHAAHDDHDDHGHDDHHTEDAAGHTEFHAAYTLSCAQPENLTEITFAYFEQFENAREVEVQIISAAGAQGFEVGRDAPVLDLRSLF